MVETNIEKCIFVVRMVYENLQGDNSESAYRYIEGILFWLYELKYYTIPLDSDVDWLKYTTDDSYYYSVIVVQYKAKE